MRLHLTRLLHAMAATLRGEAMLYELASAAPDLLDEARRLPALGTVLSVQASAADALPALDAPLSNSGGVKAAGRTRPSRPQIDVRAESQPLQVCSARHSIPVLIWKPNASELPPVRIPGGAGQVAAERQDAGAARPRARGCPPTASGRHSWTRCAADAWSS